MAGKSGKTKPVRGALSAIAIALVLASGLAATGQEAQPVSPSLTPKLEDLRSNEMLSIEDASHQIISALIAGEDARVAELAQQI